VRRAALAVLVVALAPAGAADAHRRTGGRGYVSTVAGVIPNVLGLSVSVVGGDDRLRLGNYSGKTIMILGYEREPYLRFEASGVYENVRSPAAYLNRFRYPPPLEPGTADPEAAPRWRRVGRGLSFDWHDHRIHWTARTAPASVRRDPAHPHLILRWRVPGRADGKPFAITGFLGYVPPAAAKDGGRRSWLIPAVAALLGALALALGLAWVLRRGPTGSGPSP
jgi:hypothetical protein